jgi:hypothetical protein
MWSLLDEMEADEIALVVLRYGRPAAMFIPFEENAMAPKMPRIGDIGNLTAPEEEEPDVDDVELDPDQEHVLLDIARCGESPWRTDRLYNDRSKANALLAALTRLELSHLVERTLYGAHLTRKGRRVAARLDSIA